MKQQILVCFLVVFIAKRVTSTSSDNGELEEVIEGKKL
jgi:hypothetical protein